MMDLIPFRTWCILLILVLKIMVGLDNRHRKEFFIVFINVWIVTTFEKKVYFSTLWLLMMTMMM